LEAKGEEVRLLGFDVETSGLDIKNDRIIELGTVLWDVEEKRPLTIHGVYMWDDTYPKLSPVINRLTKITDENLKEFGQDPQECLNDLANFAEKHKVDYIVGHNANKYDIPMLHHNMDLYGVQGKYLRELPVIDTMTDIPFNYDPCSRKLPHLIGEHEIVNYWPHRATTDVLVMMRLLAKYKIEKVIEYSKIPTIVVKAMVDYHSRQLAKDASFFWEKAGDVKYPKEWIKQIKQNELQALREKASFEIQVIGDNNEKGSKS